MSTPTRHARTMGDAVDEMSDWYAAQLQPKLARAAREQTISPQAAIELERQMTRMLRRRRPDRQAVRSVAR